MAGVIQFGLFRADLDAAAVDECVFARSATEALTGTEAWPIVLQRRKSPTIDTDAMAGQERVFCRRDLDQPALALSRRLAWVVYGSTLNARRDRRIHHVRRTPGCHLSEILKGAASASASRSICLTGNRWASLARSRVTTVPLCRGYGGSGSSPTDSM